ncbi:simple sugar transport system substrate-binding protein [Gracilibacillus orientalis]|uniref:Simple sugar transport system substrate-binding protein n=1 Tax=Gracilibacillus orientalis TaxID=334253 RepID=A0A1I4HW94_9BACI|nr:substrate-binding domain-containing protein [Gracilibacillus orientalis]SFL45911.1 simple sugar transport system substrate-binding protein [Gracilibacillus orientalis]
MNKRIVTTIMLFVALMICLVFVILFQSNSHTETEVDYVIGVSQPNLLEPWQISMNEEIQEEASKYHNIRVIYTDAAQNTQKQIDDIKTLKGYDIDLLIVSVEDSIAMTPVISKAYNEIPVIVLGRGVEGYNYTLYIGTDHFLIGEMAAEATTNLLGNQGGNVIEVQGLTSAVQAEERSRGFRENINQMKNIKIINTLVANWQRDKAEDELKALLKKSNDQPDLIYAHNDAMALGVYKALHSLDIDHIKIIGSDGVDKPNGGLQLVKQKKIDTTFITPTGGKQAIHYAIRILEEDTEIPKKIILRNHEVSSQNVEDFYHNRNDLTSHIENDEKVTLGFAQVGNESAWRSANTESIIKAAEQENVDLQLINANNNQEKQIAIIRDFIKQGVDVIAFSPMVENGWDEVLQEAKDAGIPVILCDREIKVQDDSLWTSFIGSDFVEEGRRAAQWVVDHKESNTETVNIIELEGTKSSAPATDRKQGFKEVSEHHPNLHIIDSLSGDFTLGKGKEMMEKALQQFGSEIDIVYSHNDDMAIGAIEAIEEYGLQPGFDIKIISIDATNKAFKALSAGKLNFTVECNPLLGPQIMQAAKELKNGTEIPMKIITSEETFTQEEAKKEIKKRNY